MSANFFLSLDDLHPAFAYRRLIDAMREELDVRPQGSNIPLPLLPREEERPARLFDVRLHSSGHSVTFRLRADNLYLLGYRVGSDTQWLEFTNDAGRQVQLIDGSQSLNFGGSYGAMAGAGGPALAAAPLGLAPFQRAVQSLSSKGTDDRKDEKEKQEAKKARAEALVSVIVMLCESTRFRPIQEQVIREFDSERTLPDPLPRQVRNWGDLSLKVLRRYVEGVDDYTSPEGTGLGDCDTAVKALGILKDQRDEDRIKRSLGDDSILGDGQPLLEILWVKVDNIDGENPGDLYGTISVTDRLGSEYVYQRDWAHAQSIRPGQNIQLTGPSRCISALDSFHIDFHLMDHDEDLSPDDEISRGTISWNVYDTATNVYDQPISGNVPGKYGSVSLNYVVLSNAVQASIQITLINGDGEDPANVYGSTKATSHGGGRFEFDAMLFDRESSDYINVRPKNLIPLLRSAVAVQLKSSLVIQAQLYDQDDLSADDEIANGSATFPAQPHGVSERSIEGRYGEIKVQVSWNRV